METRVTNGYVFFDVLVAIFIFALGFTGLFALTGEAVGTFNSAQNLTQAALLAQAKLEIAESQFKQHQPFEGVTYPGESFTGIQDGMSWQLKSEWTEVPNLLQVKVTVDWKDYNVQRSYQCESFFYIDPVP